MKKKGKKAGTTESSGRRDTVPRPRAPVWLGLHLPRGGGERDLWPRVWVTPAPPQQLPAFSAGPTLEGTPGCNDLHYPEVWMELGWGLFGEIQAERGLCGGRSTKAMVITSLVSGRNGSAVPHLR